VTPLPTVLSTTIPLSLRVTEDQAVALFIKYGCDAQGLLPYDMFATRLLSSPARLLALEPEQKVTRGVPCDLIQLGLMRVY